MESKGSTRVVLVPCPLQGHLTPMLQLATILHSRGFSIIIAHTDFNSPNPSNHPDFVFRSLSHKSTDPDTITADPLGYIAVLNEVCKAQLHNYLAKTMERHKISCIIHDNLMYLAEEVAQDLNLPTIVFRTSSATATLAYINIPQLQEDGFIPLKAGQETERSNKLPWAGEGITSLAADSELDNAVPKLHPLRFRDLPVANNANLDDILRLLKIAFRRKTSAFIWNTIDHLEHSALEKLQQQQYFQVPFFPIGPLHIIGQTLSTSLLTEDSSCMWWLDQQAPNSVIYVSLGSLASVDKKGLGEMAWGLANSKQPFLWVIRPGSVRGSEWDELLPENFRNEVGERGCIVKWAPQKEVLSHNAVGGFWSHCGWNSTLESISEGVPMICWPCFGDQMVNSRNLSYAWGIGLEMKHELERGEIERVIRKLMVEKKGSQIRDQAFALKEQVEASAKRGGSSCQSLNELVEFIFSFQY